MTILEIFAEALLSVTVKFSHHAVAKACRHEPTSEFVPKRATMFRKLLDIGRFERQHEPLGVSSFADAAGVSKAGKYFGVRPIKPQLRIKVCWKHIFHIDMRIGIISDRSV